MSKEEIISAVFERRALWDPSHPLHKYAGVLKKHWDDISTKLNITGPLYVLFHISGATNLQLIQIILRIDDIICVNTRHALSYKLIYIFVIGKASCFR